MPYADLAAVLGRAGRLAPAWSDASEPNYADIENFLVDVAGEIDAILAARGFDVPAAGAAEQALVGVNADGALLLALEGTFSGETGPTAAAGLVASVGARYRAAMTALEKGTHAAVSALEAAGGTLGSTDFWTENPDYPTEADVAEARRSPSVAAHATKGMAL